MPIAHRIITTVALGALLAQCAWSEEEEKLKAEQVPAVVKATLDKAAGGAALGEFERETKHGKTVYTAEIPGTEKGTVIEFTVGEDGTLLKTETEKEDGEKGGKEEKEEKGEKDEKGEH